MEEVTSPRTAFLGKLLGLYCIAISLAILAHAQATVETMKAILRDPPLLFIAGLLGMTAGLAIVLAHNVWSGGALPILVTLFGWASLIKGLLLLALPPETESRVLLVGLGFERQPILYAALLLLMGAYLAYAGFKSSKRSLK